MPSYLFRLLRYAPTISGEFYNVAVVLYDAAGSIVDARFANEFERLRCNPAVEIPVLEALRNEFEEQRLLGEDFHGYFENLQKNFSVSLQTTDPKPFDGADAATELDRLVATCLATSHGLTEGSEPGAATGRRAVRKLMSEAFERYGILDTGLVSEEIEIAYAGPWLTYRFDFDYEVAGRENLLRALGTRSAVQEATRLGFVMDRLRRDHPTPRSLTTVYEAGIAEEALELLELSEIRRVPANEIDHLAASVRAEFDR
jgi:hypothetical protein